MIRILPILMSPHATNFTDYAEGPFRDPFQTKGPFRQLVRDAAVSMGFCDSALCHAFHQFGCLWGASYAEGPFRPLIRDAGVSMGFCDRGLVPCIPPI